jgi:hypothetical protein
MHSQHHATSLAWPAATFNRRRTSRGSLTIITGAGCKMLVIGLALAFHEAQAQTASTPATSPPASEAVQPNGKAGPDTDIGRVSTGPPQGQSTRPQAIPSAATDRAAAIEEKKQAPNIIDAQPLSEIVKLPDINTAEALQRIPGISLETDSGEGRFINIRGLDSDLNASTYGGVRLPASNPSSPFEGWSIPNCKSPHGLAIDKLGRRLFSSCVNKVLVVVNLDSGATVATLPIGAGTDAAAFDPMRKLIFSSNGRDGTLSIVPGSLKLLFMDPSH